MSDRVQRSVGSLLHGVLQRPINNNLAEPIEVLVDRAFVFGVSGLGSLASHSGTPLDFLDRTRIVVHQLAFNRCQKLRSIPNCSKGNEQASCGLFWDLVGWLVQVVLVTSVGVVQKMEL